MKIQSREKKLEEKKERSTSVSTQWPRWMMKMKEREREKRERERERDERKR